MALDSKVTDMRNCVKCGVLFKGRRCISCKNERAAKYRAENKEKLKEYQKNYYLKNIESAATRHAKYAELNKIKISSRMKEYYEKNKERIKITERQNYENNKVAIRAEANRKYANNPEIREKSRLATSKWMAKNKIRVSIVAAIYYDKNKEKIQERHSKWKEANKSVLRTYDHNRRARKRSSGGVISPGLARKLFKLQKGKCACCGLSLGDDYHMDHIMPIAMGGPNEDRNIQLLRATCNMQKNAKHPVDFMQSRGFLL